MCSVTRSETRAAIARIVATSNSSVMIACCGSFFSRETECKRRPSSRLAHHREIASHGAREIPADRQPETGAVRRARERRLHLHEWLEDELELFRSDPDSRVAHMNGHVAIRQLAIDY